MIDGSRPRRNPVRFLAPLALAATIAATVVVASQAVSGGSTHRSHHTSVPPKAAGRTRRVREHGRAAASYYTVRPGDSLSTISARTGVSLPELQSLNPNAVNQPLQVGQRLRLRR